MMPFLFLMIQSFQISGGCLCRGRLFLHERRLCVRAESSLRIRQFCLRKHDRPPGLADMGADRRRVRAHRAQKIDRKTDRRNEVRLPFIACQHPHRHIQHGGHNAAMERPFGVQHPAAERKGQRQRFFLRAARGKGGRQQIIDSILAAWYVRPANAVAAADFAENARHIGLLRFICQSGESTPSRVGRGGIFYAFAR